MNREDILQKRFQTKSLINQKVTKYFREVNHCPQVIFFFRAKKRFSKDFQVTVNLSACLYLNL